MTDIMTGQPASTELTQSERYEYLLQELHAIGVEAGFNMRMTLIEAKYHLGEAITTGGWYQRGAHGQSKSIIDRIARDIGSSARDIYYCLQCYAVAQDHGGLEEWLSTMDVGKEISWSKCKALLPGKEEAPPDDGEEEKRNMTGRISRRSAAMMASRMVGEIWTADHQTELEGMLGVRLAKA